MKKVITYGTYDLLHQGHINLLRRAKELGDYLIVGVTNDRFDRERGKLNVCNNVLERVEAVKATGLADQIIIEDYFGQKIDDIQKYNVDIFVTDDVDRYFHDIAMSKNNFFSSEKQKQFLNRKYAFPIPEKIKQDVLEKIKKYYG